MATGEAAAAPPTPETESPQPAPEVPPPPPPPDESPLPTCTEGGVKTGVADDDNENDKDEIVPIVVEDERPREKRSSLGGASSLLGGGVRQGPLLAKLSSWSKQAGGNAKDLLSKARTTQWKTPTVPAGGILGSAFLAQPQQPMASAQLEEPSPPKAPRPDAETTTPSDEDDDDNNNNDHNDDAKVEAKSVARDLTTSFPPSDYPDNASEPRTTQSLPGDVGRRRMPSSDASASLHEEEEDGSTLGSNYSSSIYTESQEGNTSFKGTFRWAAASVVDSVQTYRGRYTTTNSNGGNTTPLSSPVPLVKTLSATSTISQTQRILQSRVADHVAHLMEGLEHHEYIMLLGHGLLGVNLKATFLHNRGVYVDYLVPHGAAATSQVIQPGDALIRIGDTDVQRSTIYKVPKQIAAAPRPVHLVLATGLPPKHLFELGHLDVAVALLHQWQEEQKSQEELMTPSRSNLRRLRENLGEFPSADCADHDDDDDDSREAVTGTTTPDAPTDEEGGGDENVVALVHPTSFDSCESAARPAVPDLPSMADLLDQNQDETWFWLPPPANALREVCREDSTRRCSDLRITTSGVLTESATLERSLQYALLEVVSDYRRRSFWERHIKTLNASKPDQPPPAALLVLFLELWDFKQYYNLMDENQRSTSVHRIAHTYFLPTTDAEVGMVPPLLDFHSLVGDTSLREIEAVLKHQKPLTPNVWRDCFEAAVEELARDAFLQFVQSEECARMRGHVRHTAPFWNVPLPRVVERLCGAPGETANAKNFAIYVLTYLLCQTDNEGIGELIDLDDSKSPRTRIEGAATGFCAALFIKGPWLLAVRSGESEQILVLYQQLWDTYLSPSVGSLAMTSLSTKAALTLDGVLEVLAKIQANPDAADPNLILPLLIDDVLVNRIHQLAKDLLYDYARNAHPKFMVHKFHEWMCQEAAKLLSDEHPETFEAIPRLPAGSIKRFLRKVEFPSGVSSHKPTRHRSDERKAALSAECAVIFGNTVGLDLMGSMENDEDIRRYACQELESDIMSPLLPENIPPTLEAYATVPMSKKQPMSSYVNQSWISRDGWEIALVNFVLPRTDTSSDDGGDGSLYGVSLLFQRSLSALGSNYDQTTEVPTQLVHGSLPDDNCSPLSFEEDNGSRIRKVVVDDGDVSTFNSCLQERTWRDRIRREVRPDRTVTKVGVALVSQSNVILSMRELLSNLLFDFSCRQDGKRGTTLACGPLIDILGNFANQDVDSSVLSGLLQFYMKQSTKPWIERPILAQKDEFEKAAGEQIVNSLPPIALAMMFVTALLEQKIVITSNRRSLLLSSTTALKLMLQPLNWCHLIVPRVPANLAADLLQYPAPFILGLPSDEPGVMELVRNLPEDVTLVDLDVGRVILAPSFAHASELGRGYSSDTDSLAALRSQVLFLAQSLGTVFGASIDAPLWACDRPSSIYNEEDQAGATRFGRLRQACRDFIEELLAGTTSCCYWIEESAGQISDSRSRCDPTVFFDEDHFFHLKNKRSQEPYEPLCGPNSSSRHLSLALEEFDLIFELFLRCQSMSMYIGGLDKSRMVYSG
eukprot:scaffold83_cov181-Amphora_coffeaeformis.AAC.31